MSGAARTVIALALLIGVWLLMLTSLDPLDVAIGLPLAAGGLALTVRLRDVPRAGRPRPGGPSLLARLRAAPAFVAVCAWDIMRGAIDVALVTVHLRPLGDPGVVEVPIGERTELGIVITALVNNLSPGSVLVDVDRERRVMLFHALDAGDPDAVRAAFADRYERFQRKVVP